MTRARSATGLVKSRPATCVRPRLRRPLTTPPCGGSQSENLSSPGPAAAYPLLRAPRETAGDPLCAFSPVLSRTRPASSDGDVSAEIASGGASGHRDPLQRIRPRSRAKRTSTAGPPSASEVMFRIPSSTGWRRPSGRSPTSCSTTLANGWRTLERSSSPERSPERGRSRRRVP